MRNMNSPSYERNEDDMFGVGNTPSAQQAIRPSADEGILGDSDDDNDENDEWSNMTKY